MKPGSQFTAALLFLSTLLVISLAWVISFGEVAIPGSEILDILKGKIPSSDTRSMIILSIRLPRALTAAAAGAVLAGSGVIFQGVLLNPLAEPYTLGVATGAALGASLAITLRLPLVSLFAFIGGISALWLVWILGRGNRDAASPTRLILAGVIVGSILGAGITLIKALAGDQVGMIVLWLLGSFSMSNWQDVWWSAASAAVVLALGLFWARDLDIMSSGADAASLGVDEKKASGFLLLGTSLTTAVIVSMCGIIGFVGLVVPHLVRILSGPNHSRLVPLSVLGGALLLLLADAVARSLGELPVGVITALIGGPIFCFLLWRGR